MYIKLLNETNESENFEVGNKAAVLGELVNLSILVPNGFVINTQAYKDFSLEGPHVIEFEDELFKAFDDLGARRVAVRTSVVTDDSVGATWAGQLESYLNITREKLLDYIEECWRSIKSDNAVAYAEDKGLPDEDLTIAVIIQEMVDSDSSGIIYTKNPNTQKTDELLIEATFGLGELLVEGMITPDRFFVDKQSKDLKTQQIEEKESMLVYRNFENQEVSVAEDKRSKPAINETQIKELTDLALKIEEHFQSTVYIEWAIQDNKIYILQARKI
jgi:phosphoenolpyruvate synthase/pyruvate phosphate dikinase